MEENRKNLAKIKSSAKKKAAIITAIPIVTVALFFTILGNISWCVGIFVIFMFGIISYLGFYAMYFDEETQKYYAKLENEFLSTNDFTPVVPLKDSIFFQDFLTRASFYAQKNENNGTSIFVIYNDEDTPILFDTLYRGDLFSEYKLVDQNN